MEQRQRDTAANRRPSLAKRGTSAQQSPHTRSKIAGHHTTSRTDRPANTLTVATAVSVATVTRRASLSTPGDDENGHLSDGISSPTGRTSPKNGFSAAPTLATAILYQASTNSRSESGTNSTSSKGLAA